MGWKKDALPARTPKPLPLVGVRFEPVFRVTLRGLQRLDGLTATFFLSHQTRTDCPDPSDITVPR
jgi:hypothetical protein